MLFNVPKFDASKVGPIAIRLLRDQRIKSGLSMNMVARRAGLSHTMISRVEHGLRYPTLDTVLRMAEAMEISLASIIQKAEKLSLKSFDLDNSEVNQ